MNAVNLQHYIQKFELDEPRARNRNPLVEQERATAVRDLIEQNSFAVPDNNHGPYYVRLGLDGHRLLFRVRDCLRHELPDIAVSLNPFRRLVKDYFLICESYQMASGGADRARLETIDMARRGLHNEGADLLRERLAGQAEIDHATARSLFTLICVLHIGSIQPW